jgi:N-acyl-L-homoserine lactone synthetase
MLHIIDDTNREFYPDLLAAMFADRKRIFVDTLKWNLPVTNGRYEIDCFDDAHAVYIIASDTAGNHLGSFRLLQTDRPHILDSLFPSLCNQSIPSGPSIREVTRFCVSPDVARKHRRAMRNTLISAMVDYARDTGIAALTGVVSTHFLDQILAMGWDCDPLGDHLQICGVEIGAFCAHVDEHTPAALTHTGIYSANTFGDRLQAKTLSSIMVTA